MFKSLKVLVHKIHIRFPQAKFYLVGGAVRDAVMNQMNFNHPSIKDMDVEIFGIKPKDFERVLDSLEIKHDFVGQSFGQYKIYFEGQTFDFAFPRTETKTGEGHREFTVQIDPFLDPKIAASRRDLTINAIMYDLVMGKELDPYEGVYDILNETIRHTSDAFSEDPLRVLRVFQFCSRFDFEVSAKTIELCYKLQKEKPSLTAERIWTEWEKWCTKSISPSTGLIFLLFCGWIESELSDLYNVPQNPQYHPEGDVWIHTLHTVDAANEIRLRENLSNEESIVLILSALCHDMGKATHTQIVDGKITSHGHAEASVPLAESFLNKINVPQKYHKQILTLVREHIVHCDNLSERGIKRLINRLVDGGTNLRMLGYLVEADMNGRPPLPCGLPIEFQNILEKAEMLGLDGEKKVIPILTGDDLICLGYSEGRELGMILKQVYEKQLDGEIRTYPEAITFVENLQKNI